MATVKVLTIQNVKPRNPVGDVMVAPSIFYAACDPQKTFFCALSTTDLIFGVLL